MSEKEDKNNYGGPKTSRRGLFGLAGGAVAAAASGGAPAVIPIVAKAATKSTAVTDILTEIAQTVGVPGASEMGQITKVVNQTDISSKQIKRSSDPEGEIRNKLLGKLVFSRLDEKDPNKFPEMSRAGIEEDNRTQGNKITLRADIEILRNLRQLKQTVPLKDLLGDELLKEIHGDQEDFDDLYDVRQVRAFRKLLGPLIQEETTAADIIQGYMGYFKKVARHAIENPDDFAFQVDDTGSGDRKRVRGKSAIEDVYQVLAEENADGQLTGTLKQLEVVKKQITTRRLDDAFKAANAQREARYAKESMQQKAEEARNIEERLKRELKDKARKLEQLEDPSKRSARSITLVYLEGDKYYVQPPKGEVPYPEHSDWMEWLRVHNPNAEDDHIEVTAGGKIVTIPQIAENIEVLNALWRSGKGAGSYYVKLLNQAIGRDLNQKPEGGLPAPSSPYGECDTTVNIEVNTTSISANTLLNADMDDLDEETAALVKAFRRECKSSEDTLTGLKSSAGVVADIRNKAEQKQIGRYPDYDDSLVIARVDIKGFRAVNKTFGTTTGDQILQEMATRLSAEFNHKALLSRIDGDEIAIVFHGGRETVDEADELVRKVFNDRAPLLVNQGNAVHKIDIAAIAAERKRNVIEFPCKKKPSALTPMGRAA